MSKDSLLSDLWEAVEDGLRPYGSDDRQHVPSTESYQAAIDINRRTRTYLERSKASLTRDPDLRLDYGNFVRFLAETPVPMVQSFEQEAASLGSGWTMNVFRGHASLNRSNQVVAVKELNIDVALGLSSVEDRSSEFRAKLASVVLEIRLMSHELLRNHSNVVRLLGLGWKAQHLRIGDDAIQIPVLLVELANILDGKPLTLELLIESSKEGYLSISLKTKLLSDVASGLTALHALEVVHSDIKPSNVLIFGTASDMNAKLSDFGFCVTGEKDLQTSRGGTPFWSAPECSEIAAEQFRASRYEVTRDYYSFGLLIWFVLFECTPFEGRAEKVEELKQKASLKHEIDELFATRYRVKEKPSTDSTQTVQEEFNIKNGLWTVCVTNEQHILRFLMQWLLVASPMARRYSLQLYGHLLRDQAMLELAKESFETPGAWDEQWAEFGHPEIRFSNVKRTRQNTNRSLTLYYIPIDEFVEWGPLSQFEERSIENKVQQLAAKQVPSALREQIFQDSLKRATVATETQLTEHQNMVGDCYSTGFGVQRDSSQALSWYEAAARRQSTEAMEKFIRTIGTKEACERLGLLVHCKWLSQVLASVFHEDSEELDHSPGNSRALSRFQELLCHAPSLARIPLEAEFIKFTATKDFQRRTIQEHHFNDHANVKWAQASNAILDDNQEHLRLAIIRYPELLHSRNIDGRTLVHLAAESGKAGLLRMLVDEYGADHQTSDLEGVTPLACAIRFGNTSAVRMLLSLRSYVTLEGDTAIMDACANGDGRLVRYLFEKFAGASTFPQSNDKTIPSSNQFGRWSFFSLASAILTQNWPVIGSLLIIGIDPDVTPPIDNPTPESFSSGTLLASASHSPLILAALLAFGASAKSCVPPPSGLTALHLACAKTVNMRSNREDGEDEPIFAQHWILDRVDNSNSSGAELQRFSIWLLLLCGADIEMQDYDGLTPLAYSIQHGENLLAAEYLLEQEIPADINASDFSGSTPLHRAVENSHTDRIEFILEHGARIDAQNFMGETVLGKAAQEGDISMCKQLLRHKANIRVRDANGQNCLARALQKEQMQVVQLFEEELIAISQEAFKSAILDVDCRGWTCLHVCIMQSGVSATFYTLFERWLISIPDLALDAQDNLGWTMLHMASSCSLDCARVLLENGATVDIKDTVFGWSPLHHACNQIDPEMWKLLLMHGADFYLPDDLMGWTPEVVLERTVDNERLENNENWSTDESSVEGEEEVTEHNPKVRIDQAERERLAVIRSKLRARTSRFYADESMRRVARPASQADFNHACNLARARAFPELYPLRGEAEEILDEAKSPMNSRNLQRLFKTDEQGITQWVEYVWPTASTEAQTLHV